MRYLEININLIYIYYNNMDQISIKNTLERNWAFSPNIDPNGDQIIEASERGYIYTHKGAKKEVSFAPLFDTSLDTIKTVVIIIVISLGVMNVYETFGCKSRYLQYTRPYQTQLFMFLAIFINIFIVSVQNSIDVANVPSNSTPVLFIMSFLALLIINIVARTGDSWAVFRTPFWPGPFSWWGIIMLSAILIFILDINREYWKGLNKNTFGSEQRENEEFFQKAEIITFVGVIGMVLIRFTIEVFKQYNELGSKFNLLKFIFGIDDRNKRLTMEKAKKGEHFCKKSVFEKFDKEVKIGRKNSLVTKFYNLLRKG